MLSITSPFVLACLISGVISFAIAAIALSRREVAGAVWFAWLCLSLTVWSLAYAFEIGSSAYSSKVFWAKIEYFGIASLPLLWLAFALVYTGMQRWVNYRNFLLAAIIPGITIILVWTNEAHGLIWSDVSLVFLQNHSAMLRLEHGTWFWIFTVYSYILLIMGTVFMALGVFRSPTLYREQFALILIGTLIPWVTNFVYLSGTNPFLNLDLTPFAFTVSCILLALALFRFHFLEIVPVAHSAVIETILDGVIVLNNNNQIVDTNPAGEKIVGVSADAMYGKPVESVFPFLEAYRDFIQMANGETREISIAKEAGVDYFDIQITQLFGLNKRSFGRLIVFRDISDHKRSSEALQKRMQELRALYETSLEINSVYDLSTLLQAIMERAARLVGVPVGVIYLQQAGGDSLELAVTHGLSDQYLGNIIKLGEGLSGKVAAMGEPMMMPDYTSWENRTANNEEAAFRRVLAVPMKISERVIGVITVSDTENVGDFNVDEVQLVCLFADQAALAIENTRLYEAEHRRVAELDALRATMMQISSLMELPELLETALESAVSLLGATGGEFALYDQETEKIKILASYKMGKDYTGTNMSLGEGAMGKAVESGEPVVIYDYSAWEGRSAQYEPGIWHSVLAVPLMVGGRIVGAVGVVHSDPVHRFTQSDLSLLILFGHQAAIAVDNSRLFSDTRQLAIHDPMTGLFNRRHFWELAQREFERARRYGHPLSLMMVDIDSFKRVNDSFGHTVGDQVLRVIAQRCKDSIRKLDTIGRYGGEEFIALIVETSVTGCLRLAERLRQSIANEPICIDNNQVRITISIGIAELEEDCSSLNALVERADQALYKSKRAGKNRVSIWAPDQLMEDE